MRPESETSEAAVSAAAARVAAAVAAAAFAAVALAAADFAAADFAAVLLAAAVFAAVVFAVVSSVVVSVVGLAVVARADPDFAADSVFAAAALAVLVRAAVCVAVVFAGGFAATRGFAAGGFAAAGRVGLAAFVGVFSVPVSSVCGVTPSDSCAAAGFAGVDRADVGLPAVEPAGLARAAAGRATGGFRTAGLRAGFGLSPGATDAAASVVDAPSRAGSTAAARAPGVGSSGSEFGVSRVTSLTYQGPSDTARSSRNECAQAVKAPYGPSQNGYARWPALPPHQGGTVH